MNLRPTVLAPAAGLLCALPALAQGPHFNEAYASMSSTDNYEYIELVGTPGASLDNYFVVVMDGDSLAAGTVDRVWDLTGNTIPGDGYFVMGSINVLNMDYDLDQGPHAPYGDANHIENGSNTFMLLNITDPAAVADLYSYYNTDTDSDDDGVTAIGTDPRMTIVESFGILDGSDPTDAIMDCAVEIGPDLSGPYSPAGYFRPGDYPSDWCADTWLDFSNPSTAGLSNHTPGTANPASTCSTLPGTNGPCGGGGGGSAIGSNYCTAVANSTGSIATISAFGSTLVGQNNVELSAASMPTNQFSYFVCGQVPGFVAGPGGAQGNLCIIGQLGRFTAPGQVLNSGATGEVSLAIDLTTIPVGGGVAIAPGETWNFTLWYRDNNPTPTSNFTDAIAISFQ